MKITKEKVLFMIMTILLLVMIGCSPKEETNASSSKSEKEVSDTSTSEETNNKKKEKSRVVNSSDSNESDFTVTLIGTGTPLINEKRSGPGLLVEIKDEKLLFDAGHGATIKLGEYGVLPGEIDKLFLTHLHSDHTAGIDDLFLQGWLPGLGKRGIPLNVWGPEGTKNMMKHMKIANDADIQARIDYSIEKNVDVADPEGVEINATEINEGIVYEKDGITITAFEVEHDIDPAYGYRVDYDDRSVIISGDTVYNENLVKYSDGADLIVHAIADFIPEELEESEDLQLIMSKHTSPHEAGDIFKQIQPQLAVYTHVALLGSLTEEDQEIVKKTKEVYNGEVVLGEDLMSISVGESVEIMSEGK